MKFIFIKRLMAGLPRTEVFEASKGLRTLKVSIRKSA